MVARGLRCVVTKHQGAKSHRLSGGEVDALTVRDGLRARLHDALQRLVQGEALRHLSRSQTATTSNLSETILVIKLCCGLLEHVYLPNLAKHVLVNACNPLLTFLRSALEPSPARLEPIVRLVFVRRGCNHKQSLRNIPGQSSCGEDCGVYLPSRKSPSIRSRMPLSSSVTYSAETAPDATSFSPYRSFVNLCLAM